VAGNGFAIYLFKAGPRGAARSECDGSCLAAWPPVLVDGAPVGDQNIRDELLGTMTRTDATLQLTYNGWPLYFYAEDYHPDAINGHDINDFGEDWYLIGLDGERPRD
jgi:predicted lipoprotein with Yx(FWY)xxD motif